MIVFDQLVAGEIAWCRFPERSGVVGPKHRPVLILDVSTLKAGAIPMALVAYGTTQQLHRLYPGEFVVCEADRVAFEHSGLQQTTKFALGNTTFLPLTDEWFSIAPREPYGYSAKMGLIHPSLMRDFHAAAKSVGLI